MIYLYILYTKENKNNFVKKDKYIDHPTFGYPVFAGVLVLKVNDIPQLQECRESI